MTPTAFRNPVVFAVCVTETASSECCLAPTPVPHEPSGAWGGGRGRGGIVINWHPPLSPMNPNIDLSLYHHRIRRHARRLPACGGHPSFSLLCLLPSASSPLPPLLCLDRHPTHVPRAPTKPWLGSFFLLGSFPAFQRPTHSHPSCRIICSPTTCSCLRGKAEGSCPCAPGT
jgi:hypothetical protein